MTTLETQDLRKEFGGLVAVNDVTLEISDATSCTSIIGPNGAGKTTFFNLIAGTLSPTSGKVRFDGQEITGDEPSTIASQGLMRTFQITQLFDSLSVLDNVKIAAQADGNTFNFWRSLEADDNLTTAALDSLEEVGLADKRDQKAENLSHGEQRVLQIATILAADPKMILLDEPTAGMSPEETMEMVQLLTRLSESVPIVIVEHKLSVVFNLADRIVVLHNGSVIADDQPEIVREDPQVQEVYFGGE